MSISFRDKQIYCISHNSNFAENAEKMPLKTNHFQHEMVSYRMYILFQATKDPYYLSVGKHVIETLEAHARVDCGFAAFKDLRTLAHEDK